MARPAYLLWYDDNPKLSLRDKIDDAIDAYRRRFRSAPNVVFVHESVVLESTNNIQIQCADFVRPNTFWVGRYHDTPPVGEMEQRQLAIDPT